MPWWCGGLLMVVPRDGLGRVRTRSGGEPAHRYHGVFSLVLSPCARPSPRSRVLLWATPLTWGILARSAPVPLTPSWPVGRMDIYEREIDDGAAGFPRPSARAARCGSACPRGLRRCEEYRGNHRRVARAVQ